MADGASGVLHSTVPPVSAPAWASFLTGRNPGKHGLYSFVVETGGGRMQLASAADIHGPKLWDVAASQGAKPIIVNVPVTWPAPAFDGLMVTGMLTPETRGVVFTHPASLADEIAKNVPGYRIDIDRALLDDRANAYAQMSEMEKRRGVNGKRNGCLPKIATSMSNHPIPELIWFMRSQWFRQRSNGIRRLDGCEKMANQTNRITYLIEG